MNGPGADAAPAKGAIYDLGYARYAGERLPPSTLWRVIMRQQLSHAWKTVWRFKLWLISSVIITGVCGVLMYTQQSKMFQSLKRRGAPVSMLDGLLPFSFQFYVIGAFVVTMTVAAPMVARDQQTGAFTFYFARPVRAIDYVIGKLAATLILMAILLLAGPFALCCFRIALAENTHEMVRLLGWLPRVLLTGGLASLAYAALPLAVSSLANRRTLAFGLWAAYYIVFTNMLAGIAQVTWRPLAAIRPSVAVQSLATGLFDMKLPGVRAQVPLWAAIASLCLQSALAIAILYRQVSAQARGSVGGSS